MSRTASISSKNLSYPAVFIHAMSQAMQENRAAPIGGVPRLVQCLPGPDGRQALSHFRGNSGTGEWHVTVSSADSVEMLETLWLGVLDKAGITPATTVMRRVFCSDVGKQGPLLESFSRAHPGAFSAIGQPPADGSCFALWSYHVVDPNKPLESKDFADGFSLNRGSLRHVWLSGLHDTTTDDPYSQTHAVLDVHKQLLAAQDMTLEGNVIRTWWYVRDIDSDYHGLVDARREVFHRHGLTEDTHYIASTGIAGGHCQARAKLSLDSYAIHGLRPGQVCYISAPEHLGPTHMYGVTFERATAVHYSDRAHIFLSGTASIDPHGDIVHPGDVRRQLDRTIENIEALLAAAHAGLRDLAMILVYLRNPADGDAIGRKVWERFGNLPMVILHAAVCRPGWLVEIEGIACVSSSNHDFPDF